MLECRNVFNGMKNQIIIKADIVIDANRERVWSFTQDFNRRPSWDLSVKSVENLVMKPTKTVRIKMVDGSIADFVYKLCRKHMQTSLQMVNTKSPYVLGGGGSWRYESINGGTKWTQVNFLSLKNKWVFLILGNPIRGILTYMTRISMRKAKRIIEASFVQ